MDKTGPTKKARCGNFHSFSTRRSPSIRAAIARRTGARRDYELTVTYSTQATIDADFRGAAISRCSTKRQSPHGKLHLHGHPQKGHDASVYVKCRLNTLRQVTLKENILFANAYRLSGYFDVPSVHSVDHVKIDRRQFCH